jgi:hypothetical protein
MPNARNAQRKAIHMLQKEVPHTKLTNNRLLDERQKGLDATAKEQRSAKLTSAP